MLLCSPPTPCPLRPWLRFPLPAAYLVAGACSMPTWGRRHVHPPTRRAPETTHRLSATPGFLRGEARASQVTGPSSSCVLWSNTPPDTSPLHAQEKKHLHAGVVVAFDEIQLSRHPGSIGFGAAVPRPARSHAYASLIPFLASAQGLLPARAGSPLAGRISHPLDDERSFMKSPHLQSPSTSRAWSHWIILSA